MLPERAARKYNYIKLNIADSDEEFMRLFDADRPLRGPLSEFELEELKQIVRGHGETEKDTEKEKAAKDKIKNKMKKMLLMVPLNYC